MIDQETEIKSCENCPITSVLIQITGTPKKINFEPANPYPLLKNLQDRLKKDEHIPAVAYNIVTLHPEPNRTFPPFIQGQITWDENGHRKTLKVGHQIFSLEFSFKKSYLSYENSIKETLKKVLGYIDKANIFEVIQIVVRYVNTIELDQNQDSPFDIQKYFNLAILASNLESAFLSIGSKFEFVSPNKGNRIIGINTGMRANQKRGVIISTIQTIGTSILDEKIKLNHEIVLNEIQSIKEEIKKTFFGALTKTTKEQIIGVRYE